VGELAINRVLHGQLPRPSYPAALRENAPKVWWDTAEMVFTYARINHAPYGRLTQCTGLLAQAASQTAHAVLASRGEWVTNEKTLLTRADLTGLSPKRSQNPSACWKRSTAPTHCARRPSARPDADLPNASATGSSTGGGASSNPGEQERQITDSGSARIG
jgi:hypothetical protein